MMFESTISFDVDDLFLGTDFTPVISSTQEPERPKKRSTTEPESGNFDRTKTFARPSQNIVKRKFPGPAGLLPERSASTNSFTEYKADNIIPETDIILCSQHSVSTFEDGPWDQMTKDFFVANHEALYETFNISWIKSNLTVKKLLKGPFLAAIIQTIELTEGSIPTVNVTLKDRTGDIQGKILYSLYEEKSDYFTVGSVIVLKQFGVLVVRNNYCLNITPNNLLIIYNSNLPKDKTGDNRVVKKILVQDFSIENIWKRYHEDLNIQTKSNVPKNVSLGSNIYCVNNKPSLNTLKNSSSCSEEMATNKVKMPNFQNYTSSRVIKGDKHCKSKPEDNVEFNCSQLSITSDREHREIWKNLFEDVDTNLLFDDF